MPQDFQRLPKRIMQIVGEIINTEISDPRVKFVSVLNVKLSKDNRYCTVSISILGTPAQQRTALRGVQDAARYIQTKLGSRLHIHHTPILRFEQDFSIEKSIAIGKLIRQANEGAVAVDDDSEETSTTSTTSSESSPSSQENQPQEEKNTKTDEIDDEDYEDDGDEDEDDGDDTDGEDDGEEDGDDEDDGDDTDGEDDGEEDGDDEDDGEDIDDDEDGEDTDEDGEDTDEPKKKPRKHPKA